MKRHTRLLLQYYKLEKIKIFLLVLMRAINTGISIIIPLVYSNIISLLLNGMSQKLSINIMILASLYIFSFVLNYLTAKIESVVSKNINFNVKRNVTHQLFSIPNSRLPYNQGKIYSLVLSDANIISSTLTIIISTLFSAISIIGVAVVVFYLNWKLSLILICTYPFTYIVNLLYNKKVKKSSEKVIHQNDIYISNVKNSLGNIHDVKDNNGDFKIEQSLSKDLRLGRKLILKQLSTQISFSSTISALNLLNYLLLTIIGIIFVLQNLIQFGDFIAFNTYSRNLSNSIDSIVNLKTNIQPTINSLERLEELEDIYIKNLNEEQQKISDISDVDSIEFEDVVLFYGRKQALNKISLRFNRSEIIGLFGNNGSGKTSIANLLLRNLSPSCGKIYLNNININDYSYDVLKKRISYIGASHILYNLTIKDNLTLFNDCESSDEEIYKACKLVNIYTDIMNLPNKFDTVINDSLTLSTGQIQKIQLARIILRNTDIMIFDEALSNLDNNSKYNIIKYLSTISKNKIIIFISHNLSDYNFCNKIYNLVDGAISTE